MSTKTTIILENFATDSVDSSFLYSDKQPGAGYHRLQDNLHTVFYKVTAFSGTIKMQATLALDPADGDWFDVADTEFGGDSSVWGGSPSATVTHGVNFNGNFTWIRAAYNVQSGTILSIQYNF